MLSILVLIYSQRMKRPSELKRQYNICDFVVLKCKYMLEINKIEKVIYFIILK